MSDVVIGIDGGGTTARALVAHHDGREIVRFTGSAGLIDPAAPGNAAAAVAALARDAMSAAGASLPAAVLCCGLAGAGRGQEREAVRVALTLAGIADRIMVVGDAEIAMMDAFGSGPGIILIAGTGSIAWARNAGGEMVRVGGWGMHLGDEGSGYALGQGALHAVARAADGRAPQTALTAPLLHHARVDAPVDLIAWRARADKAAVAALAPLVLAHAQQGDAAALGVRDAAVAELALLGTTAAQRAHLSAPLIALHGGLLTPEGPLRGHLHAALRAVLEDVQFLDRPVDAAAGAVACARLL